MTIKLHVTVRNAILDAYETVIGNSPELIIYAGSPPALLADSPGTVLATLTTPYDWCADAAAGAKEKLGTWNGLATDSGTAAYYRIRTNGMLFVEQGTIGTSGADLTMTDTAITANMLVSVTTKTLTAGNVG